METGKIHIYYGDGKGKTTSSIGLLIRSLGADMSVAMIQFDKGFDGNNEHYAERKILRRLANTGLPISLLPTGKERMLSSGLFRFKNEEGDFEEAKRALQAARDFIEKKNIQLLVLDEILAAVSCNLITKDDVMNVIALYEKYNKPFELILTGHILWDELKEKADLITNLKKEKHYFDKGVFARYGIEY